MLQKYNSIVFLDSTHNTSFSLDNRERKAFLYSILVKHDDAGCGVPVAFMITNSEAQRPLARWLTLLKEKLLLPISPIIMIDCSATEMAAIGTAFENPQIRLCHWHMLRAMRNQANSKIRLPVSLSEGSGNRFSIEELKLIKNSAINDFVKLIPSTTLPEFSEIWSNY